MFELLLPLLLLGVVFYLFFSKRNKQQSEGNKTQGAEFLAKNREKEGVQETASGLQYLQLQAGTGSEHPTATSQVKVHYHGTLLNGAVFDSSVDRGQPIEFALNQVIPGWTEGLQLMVVGEKTRFFIPSNLAYGDQGVGAIKPGSLLIFDVELLDFK
ncbi:MAG: FKBP-type peptidyl-prolyl cis-trans isomerase [Pontibacterium sp.]